MLSILPQDLHLLAAGRRFTLACQPVIMVQNGKPVRANILICNPSCRAYLSLRADFQVTDSLPNVTWPLARNWAGNIPVQREGHPNDTLFFWAFESSSGSFTTASDEPWGIWLNGG